MSRTRRVAVVVSTAVVAGLALAGLAHASDSGDTGNDGTHYGGHAGPYSGTDPAESQYDFGFGPNAASEPHGVSPKEFGDRGFVRSISPNQDGADSSMGDKYRYDPHAKYDGETWDYNPDHGGEGEGD